MTEDEYYDLRPGERFIWEDATGRKGVSKSFPTTGLLGEVLWDGS